MLLRVSVRFSINPGLGRSVVGQNNVRTFRQAVGDTNVQLLPPATDRKYVRIAFSLIDSIWLEIGGEANALTSFPLNNENVPHEWTREQLGDAINRPWFVIGGAAPAGTVYVIESRGNN